MENAFLPQWIPGLTDAILRGKNGRGEKEGETERNRTHYERHLCCIGLIMFDDGNFNDIYDGI